MKQILAESLLVKIMGWPETRIVEEVPLLARMARFKYDEYQQFGPGQKFIETLCLWLQQFKTQAEREIAYGFVKQRLVFISADDFRHLVEIVYPDVIRPQLIAAASEAASVSAYSLQAITSSATYKRALRSTLFLGLSDGSRMDLFRRAAQLDNEQVWQAYEIGERKSTAMLEDLREATGDPAVKFQRIILIDDFSASGISYVRKEKSQWKGKVVKALKQLQPGEEASSLVDCKQVEICIVLYVATAGAVKHIRDTLVSYCDEKGLKVPTVMAAYELPSGLGLNAGQDGPFLNLVNAYYRNKPMDAHELKGNTTDMKLGFAGCALPVVLAHNCPNNSIYLLWGDPLQAGSSRGLFPRIVRHRDA